MCRTLGRVVPKLGGRVDLLSWFRPSCARRLIESTESLGDSMTKPTVIIVGADKGGVGKTTISRTLLDYFTAHHVSTRAFDTESPKGTLKRFHPDITDIVDVTSVPDQMRIFDTLSTTDASVTVIDVRAGLLSPTLRSLRDIGFLEAVKKGQLTFSVFHILGACM